MARKGPEFVLAGRPTIVGGSTEDLIIAQVDGEAYPRAVMKADGTVVVGEGAAYPSAPGGAATSLSFPATRLGISTGTPTLANLFKHYGWRLDAAATEGVGGFFDKGDMPANWAGHNLKVEAVTVNQSTGTGDVVLRFDYWEVPDGGSFNATAINLTSVTYTVTANENRKDVTLTSTLTLDPTKQWGWRVVRVATDAADTMPNDVGIIAVRFTSLPLA